MKVLVTGFDPFGGEPINPAWEAVKAMKDTIAGAEIVKMQIPTVVAGSCYQRRTGGRPVRRNPGAGGHQCHRRPDPG